MRLALSSAAAPDAPLDDLLAACVRRGLPALELEDGHAHGLGAGRAPHGDAAHARALAASAGVQLAGYRLPAAEDDGSGRAALEADMGSLMAFALALGAPLHLPASWLVSAPRDLQAGRVLAVLPAGEEGLSALDALDRGGRGGARLPVAWDVDPGNADISAVAGELIGRLGQRLRHIRLYGGGPEGSGQEGRGIGPLMARLALAGFTGTIALAPSSPRYHVAWSGWLGRRGGWGCGSAGKDRDLVTLEAV
jgi:hypothetical protein